MLYTLVLTDPQLGLGVVRWLSGIAFSLGLVLVVVAKTALLFHVALIRGVLANVLVCLAVWLNYAAHSVSGKILAIIFPIAAFVALGFEHSVANMYLIPVGWLHGAEGAGPCPFLGNLVAVTLGNIIGGGVFVAGVYRVIYLRKPG
jgi:formate/nitrite transporter FocA (FNT family)